MTALLEKEGLKRPFDGAPAMRDACFHVEIADDRPELRPDSVAAVVAAIGPQIQRRETLGKISFCKWTRRLGLFPIVGASRGSPRTAFSYT